MKVTKVKRINPRTSVKIQFEGFLPNDGQYLTELLEKLTEKGKETNSSGYVKLIVAIEKELGIYEGFL